MWTRKRADKRNGDSNILEFSFKQLTPVRSFATARCGGRGEGGARSIFHHSPVRGEGAGTP